jgi:dTDP-4-amino-4,6-dideoxygalactose transaminase
MERIHLSPPDVDPRERELLIAAFDSNWIAPVGPDLNPFEVQIAEWCGREHAIALASGTAAIHLGLVAMGLKPGDDVMVSSFTFVGSVNPIVYVGARPVFIDSADDTWNIDPGLVEQKPERRKAAGERMPAALLAVDL